MFSSAFGFVRRHKGKFLVVSAVAGGLVVLGKYAEAKVQEWQSRETNGLLERSRRLHHFESTERTGNLTLKSIFPALCQAIEDNFDWESLVQQIRSCQNGQEKLRLWSELKVVAISRCITFIYGGVILTLLLRVQLSILGGQIYQETINAQNSNSKGEGGISSKVQEHFLSLCSKFIEENLPNLCLKVREVVENNQENFSLKSKFTIGELEAKVHHLLFTLNSSKSKFSHLILGDLNSILDWSSLSQSESQQLKQMLANSIDVIEHPDFAQVLAESSKMGLSVLFDSLASKFVETPSQPMDESSFKPISEVSLPLAKIIPMLNETFGPMTESAHQLTAALGSSNLIRKYSANIYEAFSHNV